MEEVGKENQEIIGVFLVRLILGKSKCRSEELGNRFFYIYWFILESFYGFAEVYKFVRRLEVE